VSERDPTGVVDPRFFRSPSDFRRWLDRHHTTAREILVGFYRKEIHRGLGYPDALDEALAFGWIDGVRKRVAANAYSIRFTPRRRGSVWSLVNTRRVRELIARGRMTPAGLRAFNERDEQRTRQYSYERERAKLEPSLEAALRADPKASSFFDAQPPGYQRTAIFWVMSAKLDATRLRRIARLIEVSANGSRLDQLGPLRERSRSA
jgi:uncharacterized protein YdeI (YjbR/CyaY-like superfamily)